MPVKCTYTARRPSVSSVASSGPGTEDAQPPLALHADPVPAATVNSSQVQGKVSSVSFHLYPVLDGSVLSLKSYMLQLQSRKLLRCGTVLTGRMHDDWVWFQHLGESDWPHLIAADISLFDLMISFWIHRFVALLLCFSLWNKHGSHSSGFSHAMLCVNFWLDEAAWVTGSPEPSFFFNTALCQSLVPLCCSRIVDVNSPLPLLVYYFQL